MRAPHLLALIEKILDDRITTLSQSIEQPTRGPRGFRGRDGVDGKDFEFSEHQDTIYQWVKETRLKFSDLTEEEKSELRGEKGEQGESGESFVFETYEAEIREIIVSYIDSLKDYFKLRFNELTESEKDSLKLTFEDLSEEERSQLRGPRGQRGKPGKPFVFEEHKEYFESLVPKVDKEELRLKFSDLKPEEKEELKLKFSDLSEEEIGVLRGKRGQRGKPGKPFIFDEHKEYFETLRGKDGKSIMGPPGVPGVQGRAGLDGKDAPYVVDIEVVSRKESFYFIFHFSDNSSIFTNEISIPGATKVIQQFMLGVNTTSAQEVVYATSTKIFRTATSDIVAGRAVKSDSATHVSHATNDGTQDEATVLGIAESDALTGEEVPVILLGVSTSTEYSAFSLNSMLLLGTDGEIVESASGHNYATRVGRSLGSSQALVTIEPPVEVI